MNRLDTKRAQVNTTRPRLTLCVFNSPETASKVSGTDTRKVHGVLDRPRGETGRRNTAQALGGWMMLVYTVVTPPPMS